MNVSDFARRTEEMISPTEVGKVHFRQTQLSRLPVFIQRMMVKSGMKKTPRMGFVRFFGCIQHMLSDTPGRSTHYGSEEALRKVAEKARFR